MLHDIMIDPRQLKAAAEWAVSDIDAAASVELLKIGQTLRVGQGDARVEFDETRIPVPVGSIVRPRSG